MPVRQPPGFNVRTDVTSDTVTPASGAKPKRAKSSYDRIIAMLSHMFPNKSQ